MKKDYLQFYQHITAPFYRHPWTIPLLRAVNKFVVWVMYVAYIVILVWVGKNDVLKAGPFSAYSRYWLYSAFFYSPTD
jgi:hypothetical protein